LPQISVPGIGDVFADGFAEEATMQRILQAISSADSAYSPEAIRDNAAATAANTAAVRRAKTEVDDLGQSSGASSGKINAFGSAATIASRRMASVGSSLERTIRTIGDSPFALTRAMGDSLKGLSNMITDSVSESVKGLGKVAGVALKGLTGLAAFIGGQLVGEMEKMNTQFMLAQKNGALLGGSLSNLRIISATAGLTMTQFNGVLSKASGDMAMFGGQTLEGSREFARANQAMINANSETMLRLGIGFEEMGIRTAETIAAIVLAGENVNQFGVNTQAVTDQTARLALQQKQLSAFNGTTIEQEKEKQRMARKDAQLNMAIQGLSSEQQESIRQLSSEFPNLQQFIKETVAFGGPLSKDALQQQMLMGATTDAIQGTLAQIQSGSSIEGAMGALRRMRDTSNEMANDLERMRDVGILSIAGSNNPLVQAAVRDYQTQLEMTRKAEGDVVGLIAEDARAFSSGVDAVTQAVVDMTKDTQRFGIAVSGAVVNMMASSNLFFQAISGATGLLADIAQKLSPPTGTGDIPGLSPAVQGEVSTANNATRILGADLAKQLGDALMNAQEDVSNANTQMERALVQGADTQIGAAGGATVGDILGPDMIAEAKKQTGILTSINKNLQNAVN